MDITHLHLHVLDRARAEAFYRRWFDFVTTRTGAGITFMQGDRGFLLALAREASPEAPPAWFHFGIAVESAHEVRSLIAQMQAADVPIVRALHEDEAFASFRCADPDGYRIEVYWEAPR